MSYSRPLFSIPVPPPPEENGTETHGKPIADTGGGGAANPTICPQPEKSRVPKMFPKPLGVMTYAEMSAEIAKLFFQKTVLTAEMHRVRGENKQLIQQNQALKHARGQDRKYYEVEMLKKSAELKRVSEFAESIVETL